MQSPLHAPQHRRPFKLLPGLLVAVFVCTLMALIFLRQSGSRSEAFAPPDEGGVKNTKALFQDWPTPDLVLILSGQMHGYLQPCGCSNPQYGGLSRRFWFMKTMADKGWKNILPIDLGELIAPPGPQTALKYETTMKALKLMGYGGVGLGRDEFSFPLVDLLALYSLNNPSPAPIASTLKNPVAMQMNVKELNIVDKLKPSVGIIGAVDPKVEPLIQDPNSTFFTPMEQIPKILQKLRAAKSELNVLLYQGYESEAAMLVESLRKEDPRSPTIHVVLCLCDDPAPPSRPKLAGPTQIITVGHKGQYIGVVGLFKKTTSYESRYELVKLGPEYETPKGMDAKNPVILLMENYAKTVKDQGYLNKFPRGPHPVQAELAKKGLQVKYVGSERCGDCHTKAYNHWKNETGHSHAFQAIEKAERPSLRQFDGECIVCHTVGYQHNTGYKDPANADKRNGKLLHVGCESCHGPGSAHESDPNNKTLYPLINPFRPTEAERDMKLDQATRDAFKRRRMLNMDTFCQKCHDLENDVHWADVDFDAKWKKIVHPWRD